MTQTLSKTMKAVAIDRFGGIETLETQELPIPAVDADEHVDLVVLQVRVEGEGGRYHRDLEDRLEPDGVLRPLLPHGQEPEPLAEGLAHPHVDTAVGRPPGGQLGREELAGDAANAVRAEELAGAAPPREAPAACHRPR